MKLYYGGYGHHPNGKQYVYWGNDNFRTGQNVVAPVTNKATGKTYNTMFTIMRTSGADSQMGGKEAQRLSQKGIGIKSIQGSDVFAKDDNDKALIKNSVNFNNKKEWSEKSNSEYEMKLRMRLMSMEV